MSNKNRNKDYQHDRDREQKSAGTDRRDEDYRSTNLRDSRMMAHLLDALEEGQDIGHYGRLTFVIIARHFMGEEEMLDLLSKQPDLDERDVQKLILQVRERGYNPPKRERIHQWMEMQDFPICPDAEDPNGCNVYRELQFPDAIYEQIDDFWEEKVEAEEED